MDPRLSQLQQWLHALPERHGLQPQTIRPASNDASFRRYFRVDCRGGPHDSLVAMDAPPPMEDCGPFVHAAAVFGAAGVSVPAVLESDLAHGFLLLTDFGQTTYLASLDAESAPSLYGDALGALVRMQRASRPGVFPDYDRALLLRELMLYPDWYVARHKGVTLEPSERQVLDDAFEAILANNLAQPRVFVHRDYHSRNLMVLAGERNPGILDFQDAVYGPITYDLVSLLRDAYIRWDEERVIDWAVRYWEQARAAGLPVAGDFGAFYKDFEWMGLQRHLKVLGIFARLCHRDGKDRYIADMPLVLAYVRGVVGRYAALGPLSWLVERIEGHAAQAGYTF
jgi:aminoglycoside/choline kinase family phosphotransferase